MDQPVPTPSISNPSLIIRIFPHESQFEGINILSLSMTLCFRDCLLSNEWIPREEWIKLCNELARNGVVYMSEAPSIKP